MDDLQAAAAQARKEARATLLYVDVLTRRRDELLAANNVLVERERAALRRAIEAEREVARLRAAIALESRRIEQTLGKVLGLPRYKDDQVNFPGATEADGVCVGEHVPETLATAAAKAIVQMRGALERVDLEMGAVMSRWTREMVREALSGSQR